jgi:large subunit ribosomal protein L25
MDTNLAVEIRTGSGKGIARKLRAAGKIPAVLYSGGDEATQLTVDPHALNEIFRQTKNRNTVVQLGLNGANVPAIVKDAQRHPVSRDILHVDFLQVQDGKMIEVMVPLRPVGKAAGVALGGRIGLIRRKVRARCAYDQIPEAFEIDTTPMEVGDMIKASEIPTPEGVTVVFAHDFNVLSLYGKRASKKK